MFYIYHIPKRKEWGCTKHLKRRIKKLGYSESDLEKVITVSDINEAADMERELNIQYGYGWKERNDYRVVTKIYKPFTKESQSKGGITQSSIITKCPHCGKVGKGMIMQRWHWDNCKINT